MSTRVRNKSGLSRNYFINDGTSGSKAKSQTSFNIVELLLHKLNFLEHCQKSKIIKLIQIK